MAISLYFGLPGCGKTTWLTAIAYKALRKGLYRNVYCNVHLNLPGITYIDNECIGKYELRDCLLLIDEATLFADNRDHKNFTKGQISYFLEHRHRHADIVLFTQQWDGVDRKIRVITDRVFYVYKGFFTGKWVSCCWQVPYGILFPDPKKTGEKLGEIVQGYSKPPFLTRVFCRRLWRPKYYKYFDSWELDPFPDLPDKYQVFEPDVITQPCMPAYFGSLRRLKKRTKHMKWSGLDASQRKRFWCTRSDAGDDPLQDPGRSGKLRKKLFRNSADGAAY